MNCLNIWECCLHGHFFCCVWVKDLGICKRGGAGSSFGCNPEPELLLGQQVQGGCALCSGLENFFSIASLIYGKEIPQEGVSQSRDLSWLAVSQESATEPLGWGDVSKAMPLWVQELLGEHRTCGGREKALKL